MSKANRQLGERAIVLGAGIAGTLVARVLASHFTQVTVIERDGAPDSDGFRKGVPQAKLVHGLLRGGLDAMNSIFPDFEQELYARGAVRVKPARDLLFVDSLGPWPRHDIGIEIPWISRPPLEQSMRAALARVRNVELREQTSVRGLIGDAGQVHGVVCKSAEGASVEERADLVVDATGRSAHTSEWLTQLGFAAPEQTRVDVDIAYACCFVRMLRKEGDALGALVTEPSPTGRYGCLIHAQEGDRAIVGISCRGADATLPSDFPEMLARAERLPHSNAFEMLRGAEPLTAVARFGFPANIHHHHERLERSPERFVCIGDALCTFNPVWGQGMSIAALEAVALRDMLREREQAGASLLGLPAQFYTEAARIIATAWQLSVVPDFSFETTRGERPPNFRSGRGFMRAFARLANQDPEVRTLLDNVYHLVQPLEVLRSPEIVAKVLPLLKDTPAPANESK